MLTMGLRMIRFGGALLVSLALAGCTVEPASQAMLDAYKVLGSDAATSADALNPALRYLRVQIDDREVFMALGYIDLTPEGAVSVWYSADKNVLRIRDGRVVGSSMKSGIEWQRVSFVNLPNWADLQAGVTFERIRDEHPGYRYGIHENLSLRQIAPPTDSQLKVLQPAALTWFEETVLQGSELPTARYAVRRDEAGAAQVVYAEQCLSAEFCFSWQDWPYPSKGFH